MTAYSEASLSELFGWIRVHSFRLERPFRTKRLRYTNSSYFHKTI